MKNLAGDKNCDDEIYRELQAARIPIVVGERSKSEVAAMLWGKLGPIAFTRAWYYWVADGPVPIEIARALYADPIGKIDVRSGGHCGCPSPDEYGAVYYDADGKRLYSDPDGSERRKLDELIAKGLIESNPLYRCVPDRKTAATRIVVDCYHLDSEAGLRLFADAVRGLSGDHPEKKDSRP
jgi:hypothetical protein